MYNFHPNGTRSRMTKLELDEIKKVTAKNFLVKSWLLW